MSLKDLPLDILERMMLNDNLEYNDISISKGLHAAALNFVRTNPTLRTRKLCHLSSFDDKKFLKGIEFFHIVQSDFRRNSYEAMKKAVWANKSEILLKLYKWSKKDIILSQMLWVVSSNNDALLSHLFQLFTFTKNELLSDSILSSFLVGNYKSFKLILERSSFSLEDYTKEIDDNVPLALLIYKFDENKAKIFRDIIDNAIESEREALNIISIS